MSAWLMLSWEVVARHRLAFGLTVAYLVAVCLLFPLVPEAWHGKELTMALFLPLVGALGLWVIRVTHGADRSLEERASAFPPRLFTLPVPAWALAGPPLVLGSAGVLLGWVAMALGVIRPSGQVVSFWPGVLVAAILAWCQALVWSPFPVCWLRAAALAALFPVLITGTIQALDREIGDGTLCGVFAGFTAAAYALAVRGVSRGRRGVGLAAPAREVAPGRAGPADLPPFASAGRALLWLEYRLHRWPSLITLGVCLTTFLVSAHLTSLALRKDYLAEAAGLAPALEAAGVGWLSVSQMLMIPLVICLASGWDLGRYASNYARGGSTTFHFTLPVGTAVLARHKCLVAAMSASLLWLVLALAALAWAAATGHLADMAERLVAFAGSPLLAVAAAGGGLVLAAAVSWLWLVRGLWVGLLGRRDLAWVPMAEGVLACVVAWACVRVWTRYPEARAWVGAGVVAALVLKGVALGWVTSRLRQRRLARWGTLAACVAAWLALAAAVGALACRSGAGGATLFGGALLLLPLARPLASALALDRARHR